MCDPNLLFAYIAVAGPGKINNNLAFSRIRDLQNWMQSLPPWCFVSADFTYGPNRRVMIPFTSAEISGEGYRAYNFYLSQLRICIEMVFGLLTTKWRRLRSILNFAVPNYITLLFAWHMQKAMEQAGLDNSKEMRLIL